MVVMNVSSQLVRPDMYNIHWIFLFEFSFVENQKQITKWAEFKFDGNIQAWSGRSSEQLTDQTGNCLITWKLIFNEAWFGKCIQVPSYH